MDPVPKSEVYLQVKNEEHAVISYLTVNKSKKSIKDRMHFYIWYFSICCLSELYC